MTGTLTADGNRFLLEVGHHPAIRSYIQDNVDGVRYNPGGKYWEADASLFNWFQLQELCAELEVHTGAEVETDDAAYELADTLDQKIDKDDLTLGRDDDGLYYWQRQAVEWMKDNEGGLLCLQVGLGKSVVTCKTIDEVRGQGEKILWVCKSSAKFQHRDEWTKGGTSVEIDTGEDETVEKWRNWSSLGEDDVLVLEGWPPGVTREEGEKPRPANVTEERLDVIRDEEPTVVVMNWALLYRWQDIIIEWARENDLNYIVYDEIQYTKTPTSQRSRAALNVVESIRSKTVDITSGETRSDDAWVFALSATPFKNEPIELVHPLKILGLIDHVGGPDGFTKRYCPGVERSRWQDDHTWIDYSADNLGRKKKRRMKELNDVLWSLGMFQVEREDVLEDLPDVRRRSVPISLPSSSMAEYQRAVNEFVEWLQERLLEEGVDPTEIEERVWSAMQNESLVKLGQLRKVVGEEKVEQVANLTRDVKRELDDEEGILVFTYHVEVANQLADELDAELITSNITGQAREDARLAFQNGDNRVLVGTLGTIKDSIDLDRAWAVVFAELDWVATDMDQALGRSLRISNMHNVQAYYCIAEHTIDDDVWATLDAKKEIFDLAIKGKETEGMTEGEVAHQVANSLLREYG